MTAMDALLTTVLFMMAIAATSAQETTTVRQEREANNPLTDYVIIDDEPQTNDIDPMEIRNLQGNASRYYANISSESSPSERGRLEPKCDTDEMPDKYVAANRSLGRASMFPTTLAEINIGRRRLRCNRRRPCRTVIRTLHWFPVFHSGTGYEYCFLPWANHFHVQYAICPCSRCPGNGICRPSCFQRRRLLVRCYMRYNNYHTWYWTWKVRNLPQACFCSHF